MVSLICRIQKIVKGTIRERRETEWGKLERKTKHETPNSGKQTKGCRRGGGRQDGVAG